MATNNTLKLSGPIRVGSLSADPSSPENGLIYYNSSTNVFRQYSNGGWSDIAPSVVLDTVFRIADDGDNTKQIAFEASGIGTGQTRTITMPNSNVNLGLVATAIQSSEKGAALGVATLDAGGLIPSAQLPPLAITSVSVVADNTARDALTAEEGDVAIVTSTGKTYIKDASAVWQEISASGAVTSVNGQTGTVSLTTTNISEGTNQYFTAARAKAAAVADAIVDAVTDVAPSQNAVFDALALKLSSVSQDTAPVLGGNLDLNGKSIGTLLHRANTATPSNFIEEEYIHAVSLLASQSGTAASSFTFAFASFEGLEIAYKIKEATSNRVRIGTLRVVTDGTNTTITDTFNETGDVGVTWAAAVNGSNIELRYTTTANAKTMRADVKRFKA